MLRVTVELLPGGDKDRAQTLATVEIANVSGLRPVSDYVVWLDGKKMGLVYSHRRDDEKWPLIERAAWLLGSIEKEKKP